MLTVYRSLAILGRRGRAARRPAMELSRGTSIALTISALLAASGCGDGNSADQSSNKAEPIKCQGGNACRGLSECATEDGKSGCTGENACAGTGYVFTETQQQCIALQIRNKP